MAKVWLDVLKPTENNLFQLLGSYSITSSKSTFYATGGHPKRIQTALKECMRAFFKENPNFESRGILNLQNDPNALPIFKERIQDGYQYFFTFFELQNNRSVVDNTIVTLKNDDWSKTEKMILKDESGETPNYTAYYDGSNFYLNANLYSDADYFVKTYKVDNFLLFNEMFLKDVSYVNDLALMMGKSGFPYMQDRNCYLLDLTSGRFYGITREKMEALLDGKLPELYQLYKRYGKKDVQKVQEILNELFEKENSEKVREILTPNIPHIP